MTLTFFYIFRCGYYLFSQDANTTIVPVDGAADCAEQSKKKGLVRHSTSLNDDKLAAMQKNDVQASFLRPCKFRAGVLHLMLNQTKSTVVQRTRTFVVADIVGDFKQTFDQIVSLADYSRYYVYF